MTNYYDHQRSQDDGAIVCYTKWLGGFSVARIDNCRLDSLVGNMRRTVYITGEAEADILFSIPAVCKLFGCLVRGYVTTKDGNVVFRHCYY